MTALLTALNEFLDLVPLFFQAFLMLGMLAIAFWQKDMILYLISGVVTLVIGLLWIDDYPGVSIVLWFLSAYELYLGFLKMAMSLGPAKGWSQFRGAWEKIKGVFD